MEIQERREKATRTLEAYNEEAIEEQGLIDLLSDAIHLFGFKHVADSLGLARIHAQAES